MLSIRLVHHSFIFLIPVRWMITDVSAHLLNLRFIRHSKHNRTSLSCFNNRCGRRSFAIVLDRTLKLLLVLVFGSWLFRFILAFFR